MRLTKATKRELKTKAREQIRIKFGQLYEKELARLCAQAQKVIDIEEDRFFKQIGTNLEEVKTLLKKITHQTERGDIVSDLTYIFCENKRLLVHPTHFSELRHIPGYTPPTITRVNNNQYCCGFRTLTCKQLQAIIDTPNYDVQTYKTDKPRQAIIRISKEQRDVFDRLAGLAQALYDDIQNAYDHIDAANSKNQLDERLHSLLPPKGGQLSINVKLEGTYI